MPESAARTMATYRVVVTTMDGLPYFEGYVTDGDHLALIQHLHEPTRVSLTATDAQALMKEADRAK